MKKIITLAIIAVTSCLTFSAAHAQTNVAAPAALTPAQVASLNTGIDNLLPFVPAADVPLAAKIIGILGLLAGLGRIYEGYRTGGLPGIFHALITSRSVTDQGVAAYPSKTGAIARVALLFALPCLLFTGCKTGHQVIENSTIHGFNVKAEVPIPFSGGESLIGLDLQGGVIHNNTVVQPVGTNAYYAPPLVIFQDSKGAVGVNANAGTNNTAGINDGQGDKNIIDTGHGLVDSTNSSESINN